MKILLAIDGSLHSDAAIVDVARGSWPDGTDIEILSVIPASASLAVDPALAARGENHFSHIHAYDEGFRDRATLNR